MTPSSQMSYKLWEGQAVWVTFYTAMILHVLVILSWIASSRHLLASWHLNFLLCLESSPCALLQTLQMSGTGTCFPFSLAATAWTHDSGSANQHSKSWDHGIWSDHFMENRWGNSGNSDRLFWGGTPKSLQMVTAAMKLEDAYSMEEKLWPT